MQHGKRKRKFLELQSLIDRQIAATDPRREAGTGGGSTPKRTGQSEGDLSSSSALETPGRGADERAAWAEEDTGSAQEDAGAEATKRMLRRQRLLRESGVLAGPSIQGAGARNGSVAGPGPTQKADAERDKRTLFVGNLPAGPPLERMRKLILKLIKPLLLRLANAEA